MNKKIFELMKFSSGNIKKVFSAFVSDKYGSWTTSIGGSNTTLGAISEGFMQGIGLYVWNSGWQQYGIPDAQRTIDNLYRAQSIDFDFKQYFSHYDAWSTPGKSVTAQIGSISITNGVVYISNGTTNTQLTTIAEENVWKNISIKQSKIIINDVEYNYPQGVKFSDAKSNLLHFRIYTQANKGGHGAQVNLVIEISDISVKW